MVDANSATAADFDYSARAHAANFWFWCKIDIVIAAVGWQWSLSWWWTVVPGLFGLMSALKSVGATIAGEQLRKGAYRVSNANNGAPDGDADNLPLPSTRSLIKDVR